MASAKRFSEFMVTSAFFLFLAVGLIGTAQAQQNGPSFSGPFSGEVTRVISNTRHVIVQFNSETFGLGDAMTVTSAHGTTCEGIILEKNGKRAAIDLSDCPVFNEIVAGQKVEKAEFRTHKAGASSVAADSNLDLNRSEKNWDNRSQEHRGLRYGVGAYYNFANEVDFNNYSISTDLGIDDAKLKTTGAPGLKVQLGLINPHSWGFTAGLNYEFMRKIKSASSGYDTSGLKVSFLNIEGNAIYRWSGFYLPFGISVDIPFATGGGDGSPWSKASAGVGFQVGVGYFFNENFSVEGQLKALSLHLSDSSYYNGTTYDFGTGYLSGIQIGVNYWF